ncbi:MAG TPA: hypothetical protein VHI52_15620 [Verrucomicrobiae bacterium]|nr:hypothetical protein [Verrucomicrobiae bacterium]
MLQRQMELGLGTERVNNRRVRKQSARAVAAQWWFERMRRVVDLASDFAPAQSVRGGGMPQLADHALR